MPQIIRKAFTLIELLVVIAIIGILSGLIIVSMSGVTQKANIAKAQVFSNSLKNSLLLNLVSEWRLDENTGTSAYDSWSSGNTGTLTGTTLPVWKTGSDCVNGSCLQFDGSDDYVDFGSNSSLSMGTGDATVSFWVRFDNNMPTQADTMIYNGGSNTSAGCPGYWIFRENATNLLMGRFSDGSAGRVSGGLSPTTALTGNTWYNITVVFDRDGAMYAYINGVKQTQSVTISSQQGSVTNYTHYNVGAFSASSNRLTGKIDELRLYDTIIPTSQIKENYYADMNGLLIFGQINLTEYKERINSIAINE